MEPTGIAQLISDTFYSFDMAVLEAVHSFAESSGGFIRFILRLITYTGYGGLCLILASLVLIAFKKTRKYGLCSLAAVAVGAIFTNVALKNIVDRIRPYDMHTTLHDWWLSMGAMVERDGSFPSGHMTAAAAFSTAIMIVGGKKTLWLIVYEVLMGFSRLYFVVHYPSDVLGGFIVGTVAGALGAVIGKKLYERWLHKA